MYSGWRKKVIIKKPCHRRGAVVTKQSIIHLKKQKKYDTISAKETCQSGWMGRSRKAVYPYRYRRFESSRLRRKKLPNPKGGKKPAPKAREWAKEPVASRRIGTGRVRRTGRICHEPRGSFRFFGRTTWFGTNQRRRTKNWLVSYLKSIPARVRPNCFSRV